MLCLHGLDSALVYFLKEENGSDDDYFLRFEGSCKYMDADAPDYAKHKKVDLPDDAKECLDRGWELVGGKNEYFQARSYMFGVEVWANYIEDWGGACLHYIDGKEAEDHFCENSKAPKKIRFRKSELPDEEW